MEIDFNMHKTNSSYFSDVDVARTHLLCTLFSKSIEQMRGTTGAIGRKSKDGMFGIALGAVSCSFKKELKPYETYEMWSRLLSWDEKWVYVVTHFVRKDSVVPDEYTLYPQQGRRNSKGLNGAKFDHQKGIYGTALSRCVFKQGRKTITPEIMLRLSGLLPEQTTAEQEFPGTLDWTPHRMEEERKRGLEVARQLTTSSQSDLEQEFSGQSEVLGSHSDGSGLLGVVSTLAQLVHLKRDQIL